MTSRYPAPSAELTPGSHPIPKVLARVGFVFVFAGICIPGFLLSFPQLPASSALGSGMFGVGLFLLVCSIFLSASEKLSFPRGAFVPVSLLAFSAVLPFLSPQVPYPTDNRDWVITHLCLMALLLSVRFISLDFISTILRIGMAASIWTLAGGANALSIDERSLFFLDGRLRGVFGHPNMTGLIAVAAFLLALGNLRWRRTDLILSLTVIAAAASLTSLVAAVIGLAAWLIRHQAARITVWIVGVISLFVPAVLTVILGSRLDPTLFTGRTAAWQWALSLDSPPLTGMGIGLFEKLGAGKWVQWYHTHNQVIMDYISGGIPLVLATVILLAVVGYRAAIAVDGRQFVTWCVLILQCATEVPLVLSYPSGAMFSTAVLLILAMGTPDGNHRMQTAGKLGLSKSGALV